MLQNLFSSSTSTSMPLCNSLQALLSSFRDKPGVSLLFPPTRRVCSPKSLMTCHQTLSLLSNNEPRFWEDALGRCTRSLCALSAPCQDGNFRLAGLARFHPLGTFHPLYSFVSLDCRPHHSQQLSMDLQPPWSEHMHQDFFVPVRPFCRKVGSHQSSCIRVSALSSAIDPSFTDDDLLAGISSLWRNYTYHQKQFSSFCRAKR